MEKIECTVTRAIFQNVADNFAILLCRDGDGRDLKAKGKLAALKPGMKVLLEGEWKDHPKYGRSLEVSSWTEDMPEDARGIEKYLASGMVEGIGPKTARQLVKAFGEKTLDILDNEPERLLSVKGISKKKLNRVLEAWKTQRDIRKVMVFLKSHDVSNTMAYKIYGQYGLECISILQTDPYRLADDVRGIGFVYADKIASDFGMEHDSPERILAGLRFVLNRTCENNGSVFIRRDDLVSEASALLGVTPEQAEAQTAALEGEDIVVRDDRLYPAMYFYAEKGVAHRLARMGGGGSTPDIPFFRLEMECGTQFSPEQRDAIRTAAGSPFCVMTGGPGTGKTTTTNGIIRHLQSEGRRVLLAAPTGRAAKRMNEATGMPALTIHRLLEFNYREGFVRNETNTLDGDALVVDEASMVDILLLNSLLKAVPENMQVVLVGDVDQLPSVGCGNCLHDIIESGTVPVIRLTKIFRQAEGSDIIQNAHRINRGEMPVLGTAPGSDFVFRKEEDADNVKRLVKELYLHAVRSGVSVDRIQILTPMRVGPCGSERLNAEIREAVNPPSDSKNELSVHGKLFREGDKVMQMRNNYSKDVFNGDMGRILAIDEDERTMDLSFNGTTVTYKDTEADSLEPAYVCTIHKSQGSEFANVIIPMVRMHYVMHKRNLLYTAVTRAKECCVIIGDTQSVATCVKNNALELRNSTLIEQLKDYNF